MDPAKAANVGYGRRTCLFIDLRLQFGWKGSPGRWEMIANAISEARRQTTKAELAGEMQLNKKGAWARWGRR